MASPSTSVPALKSIQLLLSTAKEVWVAIFAVGTNVPKGVPRPVVKSTMWHPAAARAVLATKSLPGALSRCSPWLVMMSPYFSTALTGAEPDFWVHPSDFSSSVEMPPARLPGEGFSEMGWLWLMK